MSTSFTTNFLHINHYLPMYLPISYITCFMLLSKLSRRDRGITLKGKNRPERSDPSYLLEIDMSEILHKHSENNIQQTMCTQNFTLETLNRENQQTKELNHFSGFYYIYNYNYNRD